MKLNKTLNEQSLEDASPKQSNTNLSADKYQLAFSYLGDPQFHGQYLQLSNMAVQPHEQYLSLTFYQEQINLSYKSPINEKRKSVLKKIIELKQKDVQNVRLPRLEADKTIVIQIKKSDETMLARLPSELQTTKTPLYNQQSQLIGFLSYKLKEANNNEQNAQIYEQESFEQQQQQVQQQPVKVGTLYPKQKNKKQQQSSQKQQNQEPKKIQTKAVQIVKTSAINRPMNSSNQFLPKDEKNEMTFSAENKLVQQNESATKQQQKMDDLQQNSKLEKHHVPKMILSVLKQEPSKAPEPQQVRPKVEIQTKEVKQEQKQSREQNRILLKFRQLQNKTLAEKAKMKENQRIKQHNRFNLKKHQSSEQQKSQKDKDSSQETEVKQANVSRVYRIPVSFGYQQQHTNKDMNTIEANQKRLSLNIPIDFSGRSYLQKHLKQLSPKTSEHLTNPSNNFHSGRINDQQKKIFRKPGFITSHKKGSEIREQIRDYTITRRKQQKRQLQFISIKKSQSEEKQIPSLRINQKLRLKVSRNIMNIKVNEQINKRSLNKVINQSYLPKIQEAKVFVQKQVSNPSQDPQFQKDRQQVKKPQNVVPEHIFAKPNKSQHLQHLESKSQVYTPIQSQQYTFDIIISNISVNLYNKAFGKKFIELTLGRHLFTTDALHGSHLLWVNRGYLFKGVLSAEYIQVSLKCEVDNYLKILGKARLNIDQLLLNYKQSFYQTYLYSPSNELFAVIITGFEIFNNLSSKLSPRLESDNFPITISKKKTAKKVLKSQLKQTNKLPKLATEDNSRTSLQKSKYKKYKGGNNIRIARGGRFNTEFIEDDEPGPGYYNVVSEFDRHTVSRKQK